MIQEMELKNKDGPTSTVYKIRIQSTTDKDKVYNLIIETVTNFVGCDCMSGRIRGYCKHIKFYKKLIKALLHENPGVEREKGGK